jgi:hypothetical protein
MLSRLADISLRSILSATVLAWGTVSPATRHSHPGGTDLSHQHANDTGHHRAASQVHGWIASGERCQNPAKSVPACFAGHADDAAHLHLTWLCLKVALPDFHGPAKNHCQTPKGAESIVTRLFDDSLSVQRGTISVGKSPTFAVLCQVLPSPTTSLSAVATLSTPVTTPSLLCDRARHERSGVQLT